MLGAGPETKQAVLEVAEALAAEGMSVLNPAMAGLKDHDFAAVVRSNTRDIIASDLVVVVSTQPSTGVGGEIVFASFMRVPVVVYAPHGTSTWASFFSRRVSKTMAGLIEDVKSIFTSHAV